jgi:hypothetical protein
MTSGASPQKIEFERNAKGTSSRADEMSEALERFDAIGKYLDDRQQWHREQCARYAPALDCTLHVRHG